MKSGRREVLRLLGGALVFSPLPAWGRRPRKIGFLLGLANDLESQGRIKAFEDGLRKAGWTPGQDLRIEYRFSNGDPKRMQALAAELIGLNPDILVGHSTPVIGALSQATNKIPIVFIVVADPVGSGFAASYSRPGRNITGFTNLDAAITGKLLTILKQIAPNVSRVGLMLNPETGVRGGTFYLGPFEAAARSLAVEAALMPVHTAADIEQRMADLGREANAGLIVMPDNFLTVHRDLIVASAAKWRIPTIYPYRYFVDAGGLMSYGVDVTDLFYRAAEYVTRILGDAKPGELPIQAPTKFELVINLQAAKALNINVPKYLLAGADAVVE